MLYDHRKIEKKWQKHWEEKELFRSEIDETKPKYYILDMFPYPSGAGLHVGHVTGYTATDIIARYKRQKGFNVLHPMGWDSFGLPAEQYAIRTGTHPSETTEKNINTYRRQLKSVGFSYDWHREIRTSDPEYFKWTQWIFTKLYEKGLAYEADILVNYCPHLRAVLSNEEVENGLSKEGGFPIERRPLRQWVLKITAYAEQLLNDLDDLDWPEYLKRIQRNWIGKSEGVIADFEVEGHDETISVFTTRIDTIHGVTFLAISPEHPLVALSTNPEVEAFKKAIASKSDLERTELSKEKTGVFLGLYAKHPITGEKLPIWTADYILMGYGTGAVMGVPSDDERDREMAEKYGLKIVEVIDDEGKLKNSADLNGLTIDEAKERAAAIFEKEGKGRRETTYRLRDWLFSRQRYWGEPIPILHFEDGSKRALSLDELPLAPPPVADFRPAEDGHSPLAKERSWVEVVDPKTKKKALRETNTMPQWAGSCWYYLRFCDPQNKEKAWDERAEKYWMPVDLYVGGVEHATLHLLYARFWHKVLFDLDLVSTSEPFKCLRNQGLVTAFAYKIPGGGYVAPNEVEEREGAYFKDGEKLEKLLEKMSKSKLNGVSPDEMTDEFGADTLRLYEMFMGPFDKEKLWNSGALSGCHRFLKRFYATVVSDKVSDEDSDGGMKLATTLLKGVSEDIEKMFFNTAIAKMMEFINAFAPLKSYPKRALKMATQALYPFAPHLAEECWEMLGSKESIAFAAYPALEERYLKEDMTTYVVQVNGKVKVRFDLPKGQSEDTILEKAKESGKIEGTIVKVIFIPDKLMNIVVKK